MKEEEVDDEAKEIFRRQRAVVGHVPSSESKGCRVRSLNERAGCRSHVLHSHMHARVCIFTWQRCNDVCIHIYIYITRFIPLSSNAEMRLLCKRCVRPQAQLWESGRRVKRKKQGVILNDPEWNSPARTNVEVKCGALQLRQRARPRSPRVNDRVELRSCIWIEVKSWERGIY